VHHRIAPFPFGAFEGDLVLRLHVAAEDDPAEVALTLKSIYQRASFSEVWLDAHQLAGATGRALALALRGVGWNTMATGTAAGTAWQTTPGRIVLDVSEFIATEIGDLSAWKNDVSKAAARLPQVDEVFAVNPAAVALTHETLTTLETLLAPGDGCTLYLASGDDEEAAIDACARHGRPWAVRRAGPLQLTGRAPAAAPAG
jgi:hypothetical protein